MDLAKNNFAESSEDGYEFNLVFPTGEPTDIYIKIRGDQSKTVKAYNRRKYTEFKQREQQAKRRGKDADDMTVEEAEELSIENAVVRIISWKNITENGVEVPFTKENAHRILKEHTWIREAIIDESSLISNFRPR